MVVLHRRSNEEKRWGRREGRGADREVEKDEMERENSNSRADFRRRRNSG